MRVLLCFVGGSGHVEPMVPLAQALAARGHEVAFAGHADYLPSLVARGFAVHVTAGMAGRRRPRERGALFAPDQDREDRVFAEHYAERVVVGRAEAHRELFRRLEPDLIIRDEVAFGVELVAEELALPVVSVAVLAAGGMAEPGIVGEALDRARCALGLPPDPERGVLSPLLTVAPCPPSFRDPVCPLPVPSVCVAPVASTGGDQTLPAWFARTGSRPLVHVTLGSEYPPETGNLFSRLLAGVRGLPVDVVATVGPDLDPRELGPQPDNVYLARWMPQSVLLPRCALVLSHGGSGTVVSAMAHGVRQCVVALGADQLRNAARIEALNIGTSLDPVTVTPEEVRHTVAAVLADDVTAVRVADLREECLNLPPVSSVVPLIEAHAHGGKGGWRRPRCRSPMVEG